MESNDGLRGCVVEVGLDAEVLVESAVVLVESAVVGVERGGTGVVGTRVVAVLEALVGSTGPAMTVVELGVWLRLLKASAHATPPLVASTRSTSGTISRRRRDPDPVCRPL